MINTIVLQGRLTQDPQVIHEGENGHIVKLRIANNYYVKGEEKTLFINVKAFGKTGTACKDNLTKGRSVTVEGDLRADNWEKDGEKRTEVLIEIPRIEFDRKPATEGQPAEQSAKQPAGAPSEDDAPPF